ncbi:MAG TPA: MBL fold metallo-hydrolase, partial [Paracoccaceae bacterium]|nr:MBL fold metallo-hydrolase [Paracoccaceae bacterium]
MTHSPYITRRSALLGAASLPLAASAASPLLAAAEMMGAATTRFNRFKLGSFEVTALLAGTRTVPDPQTIFGMNVSAEDFA